MDSTTAKTYLTNIDRVRQLFKDSGIGIISGSFNQMLGRLKGAESTKVKAELTNLYAQFRKENLGTAVTPAEVKFLEPLLASITDKSGNFGEKLDAFERGILTRYNATRNSVNLPEVTTKEAINDKVRLGLYEDSTPEREAQTKIEKIYTSDPSKATQIDNAISAYFKQFGTRPSYLDLQQAFPEL
jgi:hypothetical protein